MTKVRGARGPRDKSMIVASRITRVSSDERVCAQQLGVKRAGNDKMWRRVSTRFDPGPETPWDLFRIATLERTFNRADRLACAYALCSRSGTLRRDSSIPQQSIWEAAVPYRGRRGPESSPIGSVQPQGRTRREPIPRKPPGLSPPVPTQSERRRTTELTTTATLQATLLPDPSSAIRLIKKAR